jgi:hypothetical protein
MVRFAAILGVLSPAPAGFSGHALAAKPTKTTKTA